MKTHTFYHRITLLILFALVFANIAMAAEELSLFQRLKLKAEAKFNQIKNPEWVKTQAAGSAIGFVAGKLGGLVGAGIGGLLGICVGGPAAGALGAFLGYRIGMVFTRTFVKPLAILFSQKKIHKETFNFKESFQALNKTKLTIEGTSAVIGDLIGGAMGAAAGAALLAGCGPIAIPVVGAIGGVVIGQKIGRSIGAAACRFLLQSAARAGYDALTSEEPASKATPAAPVTSANYRLQNSRQAYETAYRNYVAAQNDPGISTTGKQNLLKAYQDAAAKLRAAEAAK